MSTPRIESGPRHDAVGRTDVSPGTDRARSAMRALMKPILAFGLLLAGKAHATSTVTYIYTDPQGTPLAEANAAGAITATFDYAPYGSQAMGAAPNGPGYTGHVNDPETGLVYMQARYYDPVVGRFLSVDPISPAVGNPFNFSRYAYANNNPVMNMDPDGRMPHWMEQLFPKGDLFRTTGESIAADTAFVVGAATNDRQLQATAVEGMQEATSGGNGSSAAVTLLTMGEGGETDAPQNFEMMSPKSLVPTETPSGNQVAKLAKDMKTNGFDQNHPVSTIKVNGKNLIMDGHTRTAAAVKAGIEKIPVVTSPASKEVSDRAWSDAVNNFHDSGGH